jgi:hypothetical protein
MPKIAKELSALDIKRLNKPGRHAVGYISGTGSALSIVMPFRLSETCQLMRSTFRIF